MFSSVTAGPGIALGGTDIHLDHLEKGLQGIVGSTADSLLTVSTSNTPATATYTCVTDALEGSL